MTAGLTQDEIAAILEGLRGERLPANATPAAPSDSPARPLDLTAHQERIVTGSLPGLTHLFERFARALRQSLSRELGRPVLVTPSESETVKCGLFFKRLPLPSNLHLFRLLPLPGEALLVLSSELAFLLVELLMGGTPRRNGNCKPRELSAIESRLLSKLVTTILNELGEAWSVLDPVEPRYVRSEHNPLAVSLVPSTDSVVIVGIDLSVDEASAGLQFCLPLQLLRPHRAKLSSAAQAARREGSERAGETMRAHLLRTKAELRVQLASGSITPRALLALQPGSVLQLDTLPSSPATIFVEGHAKLRANIGEAAGKKAAKVCGVVVQSGPGQPKP